MTKESESADDYSENEELKHQQQLQQLQLAGVVEQPTSSAIIDENIITTTIMSEERIHHEPSGAIVSEKVVDSVIEAKNGDNFKQHYEGKSNDFFFLIITFYKIITDL